MHRARHRTRRSPWTRRVQQITLEPAGTDDSRGNAALAPRAERVDSHPDAALVHPAGATSLARLAT